MHTHSTTSLQGYRDSPLQDDIPSNSLKFHYGVLDLLHDHGGYTTVSVSSETMTTTFFDYTGSRP